MYEIRCDIHERHLSDFGVKMFEIRVSLYEKNSKKLIDFELKFTFNKTMVKGIRNSMLRKMKEKLLKLFNITAPEGV